MVQQLRLWAPNTGALCSIPSQKTKIPCGAWYSQEKKKKSLYIISSSKNPPWEIGEGPQFLGVFQVCSVTSSRSLRKVNSPPWASLAQLCPVGTKEGREGSRCLQHRLESLAPILPYLPSSSHHHPWHHQPWKGPSPRSPASPIPLGPEVPGGLQSPALLPLHPCLPPVSPLKEQCHPPVASATRLLPKVPYKDTQPSKYFGRTAGGTQLLT